MVMKFSTGSDLDDVIDESDSQGDRSKVKVTKSKMLFQGFFLFE